MEPIEQIVIDTREDYNTCIAFGYEPLVDRRFTMAHQLRVLVQREKFGTGHTPEENERFYRWVWNHKPHVCEECMKPLKTYSAVHISHILTRAAFPEMAHDPRNTNILCFECHNRFEQRTTRVNMRIFGVTEFTIEQLKREYQ